MAESKKDKNQQIPDAHSTGSFADDLDSMLNLDALPEQQVGLIDDDDAIDRLLIGDVFEEQDENPEDSLADIDQLLAMEDVGKPASEIDEFADDDIDDLIANTGIVIKPDKSIDPVEIPAVETVNVYDAVDTSQLETVGEIDEFADDMSFVPDFETKPKQIVDEFENMTEIDEFADESATVGSDNADFLLADFDISADDELDSIQLTPAVVAQQSQTESEMLFDEAITPTETLIEEVLEEKSAIESLESPQPFVVEGSLTEPTELSKSETNNLAFTAEHIAALASLGAQIKALTKQQSQINRDIQLKSNQQELNACLETIDTLQTEQKKTKRNLDAVSAKKPVSAYVANGIAVLALLVGGSLGFQGYIAKSQVNQLVEIVSNLQNQVTAGPSADAAEKEMLRNQMDELTRTTNINAEQIAELNKMLQGEGAEKPTGDLSKQLTQLSNQDMQMGATIEALQTKVAAMEKGKAPIAVAKPAPKKPVVVQENWTVNLVAFKQDWYAKRKAEEFAAKGVPAKVIKTETKGENWYRLSVDGFNTQYEAAAYAARVKKTLNLDSVWVNKDKNQ